MCAMCVYVCLLNRAYCGLCVCVSYAIARSMGKTEIRLKAFDMNHEKHSALNENEDKRCHFLPRTLVVKAAQFIIACIHHGTIIKANNPF